MNVLQAIGLIIMKRNITMKLRKLELLRKPLGAISISMLLAIVFVLGVVIAGLTVYSAFIAYRTSIVQDMARADTKQVAELVFEHLYSVMRKGWTGAEIDDVTHRIHLHLPHHEVLVVRGEPLVRQFGDREGHARIREKDSIVADTLKTGQVQFRTEGDRMRYAFPILMASECVACHTISTPGEVNGVIAVSVPLAAMQGPIEGIVHPMMVLTLALTIALLLAVYVVLRRRVMRPMVDLTSHVSAISRATDYSRDIAVGNAWPRELQTLANSFNELMGQVRSSTDALRESSLRDPLTGLFNRRHFDAALEQAAVDASNGATSFAVLLLDLDRFKPINDKFGHAAGDAVLISVAKSLQGELRETDLQPVSEAMSSHSWRCRPRMRKRNSWRSGCAKPSASLNCALVTKSCDRSAASASAVALRTGTLALMCCTPQTLRCMPTKCPVMEAVETKAAKPGSAHPFQQTRFQSRHEKRAFGMDC